MHWIIFLKMRNSLIYSRKLIRGHKITRQLSEYKKHIWTIVFLMLKLISVSVLLGICRKCKVCSIVSFLETGGMGFSYHILWLRKWRALEFKRLVPNCPNGVFLPAQRLPPSGGVFRLPCTPLSDCRGLPMSLPAGLPSESLGMLLVEATWALPLRGWSSAQWAEILKVPRRGSARYIYLFGLLQTHLQQLKSVGTCVAT